MELSKLILDVTTWIDANGDAHAAVLAHPGTPDAMMQQTAQRAIKRRLIARGDATTVYRPKTREYPLSETAEGQQYAVDFGASIQTRGAIARAYRERI